MQPSSSRRSGATTVRALVAPSRAKLGYSAFWDAVGSSFPSLKGAASTAYYFECERGLFEEFFPALRGGLILKTDLWNEAKSTEILCWAASRGARPVGIDIALPVARQATATLAAYQPVIAVSDVRSLPFPAGMFDCVYSMGTIEHFPDYARAVDEIFRVLRPGGVAIIGVPNKLDPFLRPLLVAILQRLTLYAFGPEKSFTHGALRRIVEAAGFHVTAQTGLLLLPGWLRMLDLWCHTRCPRLAWASACLVRPFAWLYRRVPPLRRHGYLIACVGRKPPVW